MTFDSIMIWLTPYLPTITAIFSTIVLIAAGLGKLYGAITKFTNSNAVKTMYEELKKQTDDNTILRHQNEKLNNEIKNLNSQISALLRSDEFLANRRKADISEIKEVAANMNEIYIRMLKVDPTHCSCATAETTPTEEVKDNGTVETNNEEAPQ